MRGLSSTQFSKRDKPSGASTTASPSSVKLLALIRSAAAAIAGSLAVQSFALRLYSRTMDMSRRTDHSVAVMLDFVDPIGAGGWF
jgi:hypothetical protein